MYSNDDRRAGIAYEEAESTLLPVKIRYLYEFNASAPADYSKIAVPLLALVPSFNDTLLKEPRNAWLKPTFLDSWERLATNARIRKVLVPNAGVLILDDQPALADQAIREFVQSTAAAARTGH